MFDIQSDPSRTKIKVDLESAVATLSCCSSRKVNKQFVRDALFKYEEIRPKMRSYLKTDKGEMMVYEGLAESDGYIYANVIAAPGLDTTDLVVHPMFSVESNNRIAVVKLDVVHL